MYWNKDIDRIIKNYIIRAQILLAFAAIIFILLAIFL